MIPSIQKNNMEGATILRLFDRNWIHWNYCLYTLLFEMPAIFHYKFPILRI